MAGRTGLEPATSGVTGRCSNRLNYRPKSISARTARTGVRFPRPEIPARIGLAKWRLGRQGPYRLSGASRAARLHRGLHLRRLHLEHETHVAEDADPTRHERLDRLECAAGHLVG